MIWTGPWRIALSCGLSIAVVPLIVSFTQLHAVRDPAGACASRAVSVHDLACSGRVYAAGGDLRGGAVCGRGVVAMIVMTAGTGAVEGAKAASLEKTENKSIRGGVWRVLRQYYIPRL